MPVLPQLNFAPDSQVMVAAAADSGVFVTVDKGANWRLITDPNDPGTSGIPHIPRARYAHFEHDEAGWIRMYLGTQGRGQWLVRFAKRRAPPPPPPPTKKRYVYTTLRVVTQGNTRGCGYTDWSCMTNLCKRDLGRSAWRGWAGCHKSGRSWLCLFECGQVRDLF